MSRKKYHFDEAADRLIIGLYDSRSETITRLAQMLGVPRFAIKHRAQVLGVARTKEKPWSEADIKYLEANLHRASLERIAQRLGRSTTAVVLKAKRLGIRKSDEGYTLRSLAIAFGVDDHKVKGWVDTGLLRAQRRKSARPADMYYISDEAVRCFVLTYPLEFDLRRVDQLWFVDLFRNGEKEVV
ncbi:MAG: hypothetical protein JRD89_10545 [Deltaproteobacteria bacterium]|nr:hypothetical protein [Deltaproteobacteria bacterium]